MDRTFADKEEAKDEQGRSERRIWKKRRTNLEKAKDGPGRKKEDTRDRSG